MALTDSLIAYWKMDEASGDAIDIHGGNTLTDNNTVGTAAGKINTARDFEIDNLEYFSKASNANLQAGDIDFTWAAWVKIESKGVVGSGIISKGFASEEYLLLYYAAGALDRFLFEASVGVGFPSVAANSLGSPSLGVWYLVIAWHDATANTLNIQVNDGTADSAATGGSLNAAGTDDFTLGRYSTVYWDGLIDEVGFWKRVLTADERTALYNNGNGFAYPFTPAATTTTVGRVPRNIFSPVGRAQNRMGTPVGRAR